MVLTTIDEELMVAIPKREQTLDEVERTHQFAQECVELLRHAPDCRLPFNKFIPSYHHHFGRQCRQGTGKVCPYIVYSNPPNFAGCPIMGSTS